MEHGGAPRGWLDLSVNLAPHGTPPEVAAAVARARADDYASLDRAAATRAVARASGVPSREVLLTAGATEALRLVFDVFVRPGDAVALDEPTYGEYARLARQRGAVVRDGPGARLRRGVAGAGAGAPRPRSDPPAVSLVCDPNNPTGATVGNARLARLARAGAALVIDESFAFTLDRPRPRGAILVRSLTKRLALPGVRLGYVIATPATIARLAARQDPWTVGAHALAAARALESWTLPAAQARELARWRARLRRELARRGWRTRPSATTFVLADVGRDARRVVRALAARHVAVRWCASFGLPSHVRVAVRPPDDQDRLLAALDAVR